MSIVSSVPGGEAVRQPPPTFGGRQSERSPSPPAATSRSEPAPARSNHMPRHNQREPGLPDRHALPGIGDSPGPPPPIVPACSGPGGAVPWTSRSEGNGATRTAAPSASIPSVMCTVAGGIAATCVSPRSNRGGWSRHQLEIATQYLNTSLVVPTPPRQENNHVGRARPATAEAVRAGSGISAESGCGIGEPPRPQTTPAGPRERRRNRAPLDGLSHSSVERGDCRYGDGNLSSGLSSRPLVSSRAASGTFGSTFWRSASISPSPRRPVVVASPRAEQRAKPLARNASSFQVEGPPGAPPPASPAHNSSLRQKAARCDFDQSVNSIVELGYTISSAAAAAAVGGLDSEAKGQRRNPTDGGNNSARMGRGLNETQFLVRSPSPASVDDQRLPAANVPRAAVVPKLQLGRLPGSLGMKRAKQGVSSR